MRIWRPRPHTLRDPYDSRSRTSRTIHVIFPHLRQNFCYIHSSPQSLQRAREFPDKFSRRIHIVYIMSSLSINHSPTAEPTVSRGHPRSAHCSRVTHMWDPGTNSQASAVVYRISAHPRPHRSKSPKLTFPHSPLRSEIEAILLSPPSAFLFWPEILKSQHPNIISL